MWVDVRRARRRASQTLAAEPPSNSELGSRSASSVRRFLGDRQFTTFHGAALRRSTSSGHTTAATRCALDHEAVVEMKKQGEPISPKYPRSFSNASGKRSGPTRRSGISAFASASHIRSCDHGGTLAGHSADGTHDLRDAPAADSLPGSPVRLRCGPRSVPQLVRHEW